MPELSPCVASSAVHHSNLALPAETILLCNPSDCHQHEHACTVACEQLVRFV